MQPQPTILRDLGDGLILRRSTAADADALAAFNAGIHIDHDTGQPDEGVRAWTTDLLRGDHPTFGAGDFTIVEDTLTGRIVSSMNLISQTWSYGGIEFGVGRPELVATDPAYRRRGLVRAQFEVVHGWSAERGHLLQAITGIPWYYRQFGYEMALSLGGGRLGFAPNVPRLKEGEREPYPIRPAAEADLPFIGRLNADGLARSLVACVRDEAVWRWELRTTSESVQRLELGVIEDGAGQAVGFCARPQSRPGMERLGLYELTPGVPWLAVTPGVIRWLWAAGIERAARAGREMEMFGFWLGPEHPAYHAAGSRLAQRRPPYAWYVRVPDLAGLLKFVAPVLERNLAESPAVGWSGELLVSFYRDGLRLTLDRGRLAGVEPYRPMPEDDESAGFPDLSFLQLVMGYRSLDELRALFPDCYVNGDEAREVLAGLFPKKPSHVWPIA